MILLCRYISNVNAALWLLFNLLVFDSNSGRWNSSCWQGTWLALRSNHHCHHKHKHKHKEQLLKELDFTTDFLFVCLCAIVESTRGVHSLRQTRLGVSAHRPCSLSSTTWSVWVKQHFHVCHFFLSCVSYQSRPWILCGISMDFDLVISLCRYCCHYCHCFRP